MIVIEKAIHPDLMDIIEEACVELIVRKPPNQVIRRSGSPYILRWMLARKGEVPEYDDPTAMLATVARVASDLENLYLHDYARPDVDDPHDHPWPNASLVVRGWYIEDVYVDGRLLGAFKRERGDVVLREAAAVHAITQTSLNCLSLFATMPKEREWGFHTPDGWVGWRDFVRSDARAPVSYQPIEGKS